MAFFCVKVKGSFHLIKMKNKINLVNIQTILGYVEEIKEYYTEVSITEAYFYQHTSRFHYFMKIPYRIIKHALSYFGLELNYMPHKQFSNMYHFSSDEKMVSRFSNLLLKES